MWIGYALLVANMLFYFVTVGFCLPRLLLRPQYKPASLDARGLRRCFFRGQRCVVYERCINQRRHVTRYLLCQGEGCKLFKCQVTPGVKSIEYDLVLFDRYNKIFDVLHVKEKPISLYSKTLALPDRTSYVALRLRHVNKQAFPSKAIAAVKKGRVFLFFLCAMVLSVVHSGIVMVGCGYAFGGVFREDFAQSSEDMIAGIGIAAVAVLVGMLLMIRSVRRRVRI